MSPLTYIHGFETARTTAGGRVVTPRNIIVLALFAVLTLMTGCTGNGGTKHVPQDNDTIYTEQKAMSIHRTEPERALVMIDSAVTVGNITWQRGEYLKAMTQYGGMNDKPLARQICLDLIDDSPFDGDGADGTRSPIVNRKSVNRKSGIDSLTLQQTYRLLTSIEYSSGNFPAVIRYATEASRLANALDMPGEAGAMEGYIAQAMAQTGRTDEGVERLRAVVGELRKDDTFNVSKDFQTTSKKLLHMLIDYGRFDEAIPVCEAMLERLDELENHPERFSDIKEDGAPAEYLDFARGQTLAFLTVAYARLATAHADNPALHAQYLAKGLDAEAKMFQTKWSQSPDCDKMMIGAYHHLGQFDRFDQTAERLEARWIGMGDTINYSYFIGLELRSRAAEMRGRYADALHYYQRAFNVHDSLDYHNQRDQLNELATVYHLQEEQLARQQAEADARFFRWISVAIVVALVIALAFAVYFFYKRRETARKNRVLARQIAEALAYKDKCDAEQMPQPQPENPAVLSDTDLFQYLRDAILRDRLYLDPRLDRQMLVDRFGLSKERIGAAFAKGSSYKSLIDFLGDCRLPHAAKLLADRPDLCIADVARESGFPSADTFSRNFRQKYALTPSQFREQQAADTTADL